MKVTVPLVAGDPFDVTDATSGSGKGWPAATLCIPPLVAVMTIMGGGGGAELELQLVKKAKARHTKARTLA